MNTMSRDEERDLDDEGLYQSDEEVTCIMSMDSSSSSSSDDIEPTPSGKFPLNMLLK